MTTYLTFPSHINTRFLGFDSLLDDIQKMLASERSAKQNEYPPLNIYKENDGYVIEVALAGYKKSDVSVEHDRKKHVLTIKGSSGREQPDASEVAVATPGETATITTREIIRRGIATRAFSQSFTIADDLEVAEAGLEDGLLTITLKQVVREEDKPLQITIN